MACGKTFGSLNAFMRITVTETGTVQFFPVTDWVLLTGAEVRAWIDLLDESGGGVYVRPAVQYATVLTDQPSSSGGRGDWSGAGTAVATEGIHAFGDLTLSTDKQWVRFGFEAKMETGTTLGQADVSAMFQVKQCGKVVGDVNVAGVEIDATRDVPVSDWFETVDTNTVRIGYLLDAVSTARIDWTIQTADDTSRPGTPTAIIGASQVSGQGAGTYVSGNSGDLDISSVTTPAVSTSTPAHARIMARVSQTAGGAISIGQLVVNVQVK